MADMTGAKGSIEMGGAQVTHDGTDLGFTEGGVTFTYTQAYTIVRPDQTTMAEKAFLTQEDAQVVVPLSEYSTANFLVAAPAGSRDTSSTKQVVKYGGGAVSSSNLVQVIITPVVGGSGTLDTDANNKITIYKAMCTEAIDIGFTREGVRIIQCTFTAFRDSTQTAGYQLFWIGDITT